MTTKKKDTLLKKILRSKYANLTGIIVLLITFTICVTLVNDAFIGKANITNMARQMVVYGIIACALAFPQIAGSTDMGIEAVGALCGAITCMLISPENGGVIHGSLPTWLAIVIGIVLGCLMGLVNGLFIAYTTIPAFIVTLATQTIFRGTTYILTNSVPISKLPEDFLNLNAKMIFGVIPIQLIFMTVLFAITAFVLGRTPFGRMLYAIGGNEQAAYQSGINTKKMRVIAYIICGGVSAIAGILLAARTNSASPQAMMGYSTIAISADAMGGIPLEGGGGTVAGMVFGSLMMTMLANGMNVMGLNTNFQYLFRGTVLIVSVLYTQFINKKTAEVFREE